MRHPNADLRLPGNYFFKGQLAHIVVLAVLIALTAALLDWVHLAGTTLAGLPGSFWAITIIIVAPLHQFFVWYVWRSELVYQTISPRFDGNGFRVYVIVFGIFLLARAVLLLFVGAADYRSIQLHWSIVWVIGPLMAVMVAYTMISIQRYFGFERAVGGDHFFQKYRAGFVRKGIFKYISNAMYTFGFMIVFLIGIIFSSKAVLLLAAFQYLALWTHYFCTEKPDIAVLYAPE